METTKEPLLREMSSTMEDVINVFTGITEINKRPFENSWTAAQVLQHLVLSNGGFAEMMGGDVSDSDRDPGANIDMIRTIFLDFTTKMKSPEFIVPRDQLYDKADLLSQFATIKERLLSIIQTEDLAKLCTTFELPQMGFLTRLEAVHFVLYHTQRHTHQLNEIGKALAESMKIPENA